MSDLQLLTDTLDRFGLSYRETNGPLPSWEVHDYPELAGVRHQVHMDGGWTTLMFDKDEQHMGRFETEDPDYPRIFYPHRRIPRD